jgi:hypothetical protein
VIQPPRVNGTMNGVVSLEGHENLADADDTIFAVSLTPNSSQVNLKADEPLWQRRLSRSSGRG